MRNTSVYYPCIIEFNYTTVTYSLHVFVLLVNTIHVWLKADHWEPIYLNKQAIFHCNNYYCYPRKKSKDLLYAICVITAHIKLSKLRLFLFFF